MCRFFTEERKILDVPPGIQAGHAYVNVVRVVCKMPNKDLWLQAREVLYQGAMRAA